MVSSERRRRAELISTVGAGVLGAGLGLLLARALAPYTLPLLLIGLGCHAWGMYEKHQADVQQGEQPPTWAKWIYWSCWVLLGVLAVFIVLRSRESGG
jgi:hypothetical protein